MMRFAFWDISRLSSYSRIVILLPFVLIGFVACQAATTVTATSKPSIASPTSPFVKPTTILPSATPPSATRRIIATIPLDWKPTLIAQGNGVLWVIGREDHFVARLDPHTNQIIGQPTTLAEPIYDVLVGEEGVWVTGDTVVTRLDATTGEVIASLRADQFGDGTPFRLAVGDGLIWLLNLENAPSGVHKIDPQTNEFVDEAITVGVEAVGITFGAGSIWTADHDDGTVSRVDPKTNQRVATILMPSEPHYIYFNPDDGLVWVANYHINSISRIDPRTNQLIGEPLPVPFAPEWMTSGDNKTWIVPSPYAENNVRQNFEGVAEFDAINTSEARLVMVKGRPMDAALSDGSLWITTQDPNQVLRLDLE